MGTMTRGELCKVDEGSQGVLDGCARAKRHVLLLSEQSLGSLDRVGDSKIANHQPTQVLQFH